LESAHLAQKSQGNKARKPQNLVLHGSKDTQDVVSDGDSGDKKPAEKPVSLHPLEFEEAVRDLLKAKSDNGRRKQQRRSRL